VCRRCDPENRADIPWLRCPHGAVGSLQEAAGRPWLMASAIVLRFLPTWQRSRRSIAGYARCNTILSRVVCSSTRQLPHQPRHAASCVFRRGAPSIDSIRFANAVGSACCDARAAESAFVQCGVWRSCMATRRCRRWWCKRRKSELSGKKLSKNSGKSERPRHATAHAIARSLKPTRARYHRHTPRHE
jgi:hypothetical protein